MKMTYVKYECAQCGAQDTDKLFPHERAQPAVSCFKCHAGMGKSLEQMGIEQIGMFPKSVKS